MDRWVDLERTEPSGIRRLFDAVLNAPQQAPEEREQSKQSLLRALAEQERR